MVNAAVISFVTNGFNVGTLPPTIKTILVIILFLAIIGVFICIQNIYRIIRENKKEEEK